MNCCIYTPDLFIFYLVEDSTISFVDEEFDSMFDFGVTASTARRWEPGTIKVNMCYRLRMHQLMCSSQNRKSGGPFRSLSG